jgi:hypothetical protein
MSDSAGEGKPAQSSWRVSAEHSDVPHRRGGEERQMLLLTRHADPRLEDASRTASGPRGPGVPLNV